MVSSIIDDIFSIIPGPRSVIPFTALELVIYLWQFLRDIKSTQFPCRSEDQAYLIIE